MQSCIYEGRVTHRRHTPVVHTFQYRLYMAYLDLEELRSVAELRRLIPRRRFSRGSFLAADHLRGYDGPTDEAARDLVEKKTGFRPCGPIRLLTQLRHLGYYFSPLNLFYCYDAGGMHVDAVVAEVTNTPWREQHHYVLWEGNRTAPGCKMRFAHAKAFHVSPFIDMQVQYRWLLTEPDRNLVVRLENHRDREKFFDATLALSRLPLEPRQVRRMFVRYPLMTGSIVAAIHWQAFKLWWKKCPVYSHPKKQQSSPTPTA